MKTALPYFSKYWPTFRAPGKVRHEFITSDPDRLQHINENARPFITSGPLAKGMLDRGKKLLDPEFIKNSIDRPIAIFHGTSDFIDSYDASVEYINKITVTDKQLYGYPNIFHDFFQERPETIQIVMKDLRTWLDDHCPKKN